MTCPGFCTSFLVRVGFNSEGGTAVFRFVGKPTWLLPGVSQSLQQRKNLPTLTRHFSQGVILGSVSGVQVSKNKSGASAPLLVDKILLEIKGRVETALPFLHRGSLPLR